MTINKIALSAITAALVATSAMAASGLGVISATSGKLGTERLSLMMLMLQQLLQLQLQLICQQKFQQVL